MGTLKLILSSACVFILACSLVSGEDDENTKKIVRISRSKYKYNHPPAAENEENIPVAIVYDKVIDRGSRAEKTVIRNEPHTTVSILDKEAQKAEMVKESVQNNKNEFKQETLTDLKVSINDRKEESVNSRIQLKSQRSRHRNHQLTVAKTNENIPVAVIYDKIIDRSVRTDKMLQKNTRATINKGALNETLKNVNNAKITDSANTGNQEITKTIVEGDENQLSKNDKVILKEIIVNDTSRQDKTPQPKQLNLKIPVSVVYDAEPIEIKRKSSRNRVITKMRKQHRDQTNTASKTKKESEVLAQTRNVNANVKNDTGVSFSKVSIAKSLNETSQSENTKIKIDNVKTLPENSMKNKNRTRERDPIVPIIESENKVFSQTGEFVYSYEGGDGTKAYSNGILKSFDEDKTGESVIGGFSYKDKDGKDFSLSYTADENGYRPVGAHLPTPPPIPAAIARALKYLATKPTLEPVTEAVQTNLPIQSTKKPSSQP